MADLEKMLTQVRDHYVGMFEAALNELRGKGHALIIEPPAVNEAGELAREGVLDIGMRYDLAIEEDGAATPSQFAPSKMLKFGPESFFGAGLNIVLAPLRWDEAHLAIEGEPKAIAAALKEWFESALAAPDDVKQDEIQRAAHFLSDPEVEGTTTRVQADFGTADAYVVMALFDTLRLAGASRVELGLPEA